MTYGQMAPKRIPPELRFWTKVNKTDTCWLWTGAKSSGGYGNFHDGDRYVPAHRFAYLIERGVIPDGLSLDHLCRVRLCVNPYHLEPVTAQENFLRSPLYNANKTHCPAGHEYSEPNTYRSTNGSRRCRECVAIGKRKERGVTVVKVYNTKRRRATI